jgi:hypothetical protein
MGVWSKVLEALIAMGYSNGRLSLDRVAVDSSTVKAGKGRACRLRWVLEG